MLLKQELLIHKIRKIKKLQLGICLNITPTYSELKQLNFKYDFNGFCRFFNLAEEVSNDIIAMFYLDIRFFLGIHSLLLKTLISFILKNPKSIFIINFGHFEDTEKTIDSLMLKQSISKFKNVFFLNHDVINLNSFQDYQQNKLSQLRQFLSENVENRVFYGNIKTDIDKIVFINNVEKNTCFFVTNMTSADFIINDNHTLIPVIQIHEVFEKNIYQTRQNIRLLWQKITK